MARLVVSPDVLLLIKIFLDGGEGVVKARRDSPGLVLGRIVCQVINEAAFALGEGIGSPEDVDAGMVHGLRIGAKNVTSLTYLRQGQDNGVTLPGRPEAGDHFGAGHLGQHDAAHANAAAGA